MKEKKSKEKNEIMTDTKKQIIKSGVIAVIIILCFAGMYVAYSIMQENLFTRAWQAITMILLGLSIIIFEIAYRKDSGILAINGIETLVLAFFTLTLEYIKIRFNIDVRLYVIIGGSVFLVYYLLKIFTIYTSGRKKVLNSLSDIADIVKEDKPNKKEAVKHKKEEDEEND